MVIPFFLLFPTDDYHAERLISTQRFSVGHFWSPCHNTIDGIFRKLSITAEIPIISITYTLILPLDFGAMPLAYSKKCVYLYIFFLVLGKKREDEAIFIYMCSGSCHSRLCKF